MLGESILHRRTPEIQHCQFMNISVHWIETILTGKCFFSFLLYSVGIVCPLKPCYIIWLSVVNTSWNLCTYCPLQIQNSALLQYFFFSLCGECALQFDLLKKFILINVCRKVNWDYCTVARTKPSNDVQIEHL